MIKGIPSDIERILEAGNSAPSGENCQPWHFIVRDKTIEVHLLPERDQSAYSWGQRTSYLANGAVVENMIIAASAEQYQAEVQYFPNPKDAWHTATIFLQKDTSIIPDPLATYINKRISNRKPYKKDSLTDKERRALLEAIEDKSCSSVLVEERENIDQLGRVGSTNEEVMLANRRLHQFFFNHVNWTKEEDEEKKIGFYIKTLELSPSVEFMFKVFRNWSRMRIFDALGFNRVVGKQNGVTNASAAAMATFMIARTEPLDFVKIGRAIERFWLTATALGLSSQPLTGLLFFKLKIDGGEGEIFSQHEQNLIMDAYQKTSRICNANGNHIVFMFRIGRSTPASAHAVRFPLEDVVTIV